MGRETPSHRTTPPQCPSPLAQSSSTLDMSLAPAGVTGNAAYFVIVPCGHASGPITVTAASATSSPQTIQVNVTLVTLTGATFGSFDPPVNNTSGVVGAIQVTGWA